MTPKIVFNQFDSFIHQFDQALRTVAGVVAASRPNPAKSILEQSDHATLNEQERKHSAGLMRVNHVGEVCAQALYQAQGLFAYDPQLRQQFHQASREEQDHLAWTAQRVHELGSHVSFLNPLWYVGAFAIGAIAAHMGDATSLGFVVETERQVEAHLTHHLNHLPEHDASSRAIVEQMRADEIQHGHAAQALGAAELSMPVKTLMAGMAKIMTTATYYI
jgi:ubiquinone biosynthesis monooxygenase Coq7